MKPVYKLILHITHNLFPLNEYSEGEIKRLMDKFKEEADDLNIEITDNQLKNYITRFDQLKNSPKITEKDLRKYSLSKLIKLVSSTKGTEEKDELDNTPDIVYNEDGIIIYNGSKENNCLTYGAGERWCITKGSFANYRYDNNRKNPTFYLVKDTNKPDSNPQSFFVVVVGSDNTYKVSDRTNNDVGGTGTEWERWENWSFVEQHFPSVTGLHHIFKYIPLSSKEKLSRQYKNKPMPFREWLKQPFSFKEQYLVLRKGEDFFSDISNEEFIIKFIPKLPNVAHILAKNNDIAGTLLLLKTIEYFNKQDQNSIISNIREPLYYEYLSTELISFDIKKLLVKLNKWVIEKNQRIYVTKDGSAIVLLTLGEELKISIFTEDDDYPNVKLNNRTAKYILDYPELDNIPIKYLMDLLQKGAIPEKDIEKIIDKAKENPDSSIIVKNINDKEIILDTKSLTAFIVKDNKIKKADLEDEDVQTVFNSLQDNENVIEQILNIFEYRNDIPNYINKEFLKNVITSLPYSKRIVNSEVVLFKDIFYCMPSIIQNSTYFLKSDNAWNPNYTHQTYSKTLNQEQIEEYFKYLRETNQTLNDFNIKNNISTTNWTVGGDTKRLFFITNPPLNPTNNLIPKEFNGNYILINKENPSSSSRLSATGKLVKANISARKAAELLGINIPTGRRGRPSSNLPNPENPIRSRIRGRGRPPGRRPVEIPQNNNEGDIDVDDLFTEQGLIRGFEQLPRFVRTVLGNQRGQTLRVRGNRGAARRQNMLGAVGDVTNVTQFGRSTVYIITLNNRTKVASIVIQPGNRHYVVSRNEANWINSPSELVTSLRNNDLLEIRNYIIKDYIQRNPQHLSETKKLLKQYIDEIKIN